MSQRKYCLNRVVLLTLFSGIYDVSRHDLEAVYHFTYLCRYQDLEAVYYLIYSCRYHSSLFLSFIAFIINLCDLHFGREDDVTL